MAFIKCPECGSRISQNAKVCIYCDYVLDSVDFDEEESADKKFKVILFKVGPTKLAVISQIRKLFNMDLAAAKEATNNAPCELGSGLTIQECRLIRTEIENCGGKVEIVEDK